MELQFEQQILNLEKLFNSLSDTVTFHLTVQWGALAFVVAATGTALFVLAKHWVNKRVGVELSRIDDRIKNIIQDNPPFHYASGSNFLSNLESKHVLKLHGLKVSDDFKVGFSISGLKNFSKERLLSLEVIDSKGNVLENKLFISDDGVISVTLKEEVNGQVSWTAVWLKETYIKMHN